MSSVQLRIATRSGVRTSFTLQILVPTVMFWEPRYGGLNVMTPWDGTLRHCVRHTTQDEAIVDTQLILETRARILRTSLR
jgi:hypothetical protein